MKTLWLLIASLLFAMAAPAAAEVLHPTVEGRTFDLYQPDGAGPAMLPLVVLLHGASGNATVMENQMPLFDFMDRHPFRLAYLSATKFELRPGDVVRVWNDKCCEPGIRPVVDDSGYIDAVIRDLNGQGLVETGQVFLVGHSNGAKMAYRYMCDHGGVATAIVAISGALDIKDCAGVAGTRVLNIHGGNDKHSPVDGGYGESDPPIMQAPIAQCGTDLQVQGATFNLIVVPQAGHLTKSINAEMKQSSGVGLDEAVYNFLFSNTIPQP